MLVEFAHNKYQWFKNIPVEQNTDAYRLTEFVTKGDLTATYYPTLRAHMITSLLGQKSDNTYYWALWRWNNEVSNWELIPVGADLFIIEDREVLAWKYTNSHDTDGQNPTQTP